VDEFAVVTAGGQLYVADSNINSAPTATSTSYFRRVPYLHGVRRVCFGQQPKQHRQQEAGR